MCVEKTSDKNYDFNLCEISANTKVNEEIFILHFNIEGKPAPGAGQFYMLLPESSSVFLPRPVSIFEFNESQNIVKFLIGIRGKGTAELSKLRPGDKVRLTGPLGNSWADFLPENGTNNEPDRAKFPGTAALVGGSLGVAPLAALVTEKSDYNFHFYAGFRQGFKEKKEENIILGPAANAKKIILSAEDGRNALNGRIVDFLFEPSNFNVIFACGPTPMLKAVKNKCEKSKVPCFLSLESRMACGVGACLGCTIRTKKGNRCSCKDGPIFPAGEVIFDE